MQSATISATRDALEAGFRLFNCAHRCCPAGGKAIGDNGGVTKRAEVAPLIKGAVDKFGRVDVIVNDADIMPIAQIDALKVEEWDRQI